MPWSALKRRLRTEKSRLRLPEEFCLVPMDGKLIQPVITNLLTNAVKHTDEKRRKDRADYRI